MKRLAVLIALVVVAGCDNTRYATKQAPVDVHIAPECRQKCSINVSMITADPNGLIEATKDAVKKCEARRALCDSALQRAENAGAIK